MSIKERLDQARIDYDYICTNYGPPSDFTGSGMEDIQFHELLAKPSKHTAYKIYVERIESLFDIGYDDPTHFGSNAVSMLPMDDAMIQIIGERYCLIDLDDDYEYQ